MFWRLQNKLVESVQVMEEPENNSDKNNIAWYFCFIYTKSLYNIAWYLFLYNNKEFDHSLNLMI